MQHRTPEKAGAAADRPPLTRAVTWIRILHCLGYHRSDRVLSSDEKLLAEVRSVREAGYTPDSIAVDENEGTGSALAALLMSSVRLARVRVHIAGSHL